MRASRIAAVVGLTVVGLWAIASTLTWPSHPEPAEPRDAITQDGPAPDTPTTPNSTSPAEPKPDTFGPASTTTQASPPTSKTIPPDVARPRPPVDLAEPPDSTDPLEVARWWAGTHTAHEGAEPAAELADRLQTLTDTELVAELRAYPPAATYGDPTPVLGVSANEPVANGSTHQLRVTVETPGALVVYDLELTQRQGRWLVHQATPL